MLKACAADAPRSADRLGRVLTLPRYPACGQAFFKIGRTGMAGSAAGSDERMRETFLAQARGCAELGSPFTSDLCIALAAALDRCSETGRKVLDWPGDPQADALALRLCGALHALVLDGADRILAAAFPPRSASPLILGALLPAVFRQHDERISAALDHPPQTNEVERAAMLLPGFLLLARETGLPLDLHEIGASAGLIGLFDRFAYRFGGATWGDAEGAVQLAPEMRGKAVRLDGELKLAARGASDKLPIHLLRPAERLRLRSFVWPDQTDRLRRLDAAIALAATVRLRAPEKADAGQAVANWLEARREGAAAVLFHSIVWQYLPPETKHAVVAAMAAAGAQASMEKPLAWLRMEPLSPKNPFAALSLTVWPGGATRHLADCDYHGRWIAWH